MAIKQTTHAELAILGLIFERPRHGYEIEAVIEERGMRDWTEVAFSSIYYILRKLEKRKLIQGRLVLNPGKGPARKVYQITEKGSETWFQATVEALSQPVKGSDPFLLGLAGLPVIPTSQSLEALRRYREELQNRKDHVKRRWQTAGDHLPTFLDGMFDFSVTLLDARIDWVERFITRLEREPNEEGQFRLPLGL